MDLIPSRYTKPTTQFENPAPCDWSTWKHQPMTKKKNKADCFWLAGFSYWPISRRWVLKTVWWALCTSICTTSSFFAKSVYTFAVLKTSVTKYVIWISIRTDSGEFKRSTRCKYTIIQFYYYFTLSSFIIDKKVWIWKSHKSDLQQKQIALHSYTWPPCEYFSSFDMKCASWGVAQSTELWLLTTRAGVRISTVLTNAMHKFIELYALNQITLGVWCTPS